MHQSAVADLKLPSPLPRSSASSPDRGILNTVPVFHNSPCQPLLLCETFTALLTLSSVPLSFPPPAEPAQCQSVVRPFLGITFATPLALQAANADVSRIERFFPTCHTPQAALPKSPNNSQVLSNLAQIICPIVAEVPPFSTYVFCPPFRFNCIYS